MRTEIFTVDTGRHRVVHDLTADHEKFLQDGDGLLDVVWHSICLVDTDVDNPDRDGRPSFLAG